MRLTERIRQQAAAGTHQRASEGDYTPTPYETSLYIRANVPPRRRTGRIGIYSRGGVGVRPGHRLDQSRPEHIVCDREDRDRLRCLLNGAYSRRSARIDHINLGLHQLGCIFRHQLAVQSKCADNEREIFALNETALSQCTEQGNYSVGLSGIVRRIAG
jgi:hypothetical protein